MSKPNPSGEELSPRRSELNRIKSRAKINQLMEYLAQLNWPVEIKWHNVIIKLGKSSRFQDNYYENYFKINITFNSKIAMFGINDLQSEKINSKYLRFSDYYSIHRHLLNLQDYFKDKYQCFTPSIVSLTGHNNIKFANKRKN